MEQNGPVCFNETQQKSKVILKLMILAAILVAALFFSFFLGRYSLSPREVFLLVREKLFDIGSGLGSSESKVFFGIRLPRVLAACIIGCGLSMSGCVYQGTFRNPMVSPDILGATAGAGLGAAVALMLDLNYFGVQALAFVFGLIAVGGTYLLATLLGDRNNTTLSLVLTGMVMSALFQAGISLMKYIADPYSKLPAITFWLMGSLSSMIPSSLPLLVVPLAIGAVPLFLLRWKINLLSLSDDEALSMGVNTSRLRLLIILCATLITSSVVAVGGIIGWVGLIIPHIARIIVGPDHKYLIPASMLLGSAYLLLVDDVARAATSLEIPIGILTAAIGAPFFIFLMYQSRRRSS